MSPRIEPLSGMRAPLWLRLLNPLVRRFYGRELLPLNVMAHSPRVILPYLFMSGFVSGGSKAEQAIHALVAHRVNEINGCSWCLDFGSSQALGLGVAQDKLDAVERWATSPLFSSAERAALAFGEAVAQTPPYVSDEVFQELRAHFSERQVIELLSATCAHTFFNRFNAPLGIESQGFCAIGALGAKGARAA